MFWCVALFLDIQLGLGLPTLTLVWFDVAVNRLDRLTSGLMIMALSGPASRDLAKEFVEGKVRKEYVARVKGRFPEFVTICGLGVVVRSRGEFREELEVEKPLMTVDRQMGLVIVTPEGKVCHQLRGIGLY